MAKKKKFYGGDKMNTVFSSDDKKTPVSQIPNGSTGSYGDDMTYIDREINKNSNYKKNRD